MVIDVWNTNEYNEGHIQNTLSIPLTTYFAIFAGSLHNDEPVIIVGNSGDEVEAISRLTRVGIDNILGYLDGGVTAWKQPLIKTNSITSNSFVDISKNT